MFLQEPCRARALLHSNMHLANATQFRHTCTRSIHVKFRHTTTGTRAPPSPEHCCLLGLFSGEDTALAPLIPSLTGLLQPSNREINSSVGARSAYHPSMPLPAACCYFQLSCKKEAMALVFNSCLGMPPSPYPPPAACLHTSHADRRTKAARNPDLLLCALADC
jgi:hypothetical protein